MTSKLLSVSIAAYNVEKFLADCLDSCCVNASEKLEVIIVNDGSSDSTLEIARAYERRNPQMFKVIDKQNGGYGSTVNASLSAATGRYFRYLDGDDWFDAIGLERYVDLLAECDGDAVYTPYLRVYEDGSPSELRDDLAHVDEGSYRMADLQDAPHIAACALAYRTQMLRDSGFAMTERCFYTDVEYACLPFMHVKTLHVSKIPLYRYRIGREGQSVSLAGIERHYRDIIRVCRRLLREICGDCRPCSLYLTRCLISECATVYSFLTRIPPTAERKADLMAFDAMLREFESVYEATAERSKRARLLRVSRFLAYAPLCRLSARGLR